jgi:hypothetical protein
MVRPALIAAFGASVLLAGCESTMMGPAPTAGPVAAAAPSPLGGPARYRAEDFAWSEGAGRNSVVGKLAYAPGKTRYTCVGASVILTPETPWTRERMLVLYRSDEHAAAPSDEVRARTPNATAGGDYSAWIRRTTCDATDRYSFAGVPNGAWYVITTAKPAGQPNGASVAVMRRVVASGGKVIVADL